MKLLINLCANDGIVSHYAGVGTMTMRYIDVLCDVLEKQKHQFLINLFTTIYHQDSFGFNEMIKNKNLKRKNVKVFEIDNKTNGQNSFGTVENWEELSKNTAEIINSAKKNLFDKIITIANDIPYCNLARFLELEKNHSYIYIPHSTNYIFPTKDDNFAMRNEQKYEKDALNFLNNKSQCYFGVISNFMKNHLVEQFGVKKNKLLDIFNGENFNEKVIQKFDNQTKKLFATINKHKNIVMCFGRSEEEKNLDKVMMLKNYLNIPTVVITRTYGFNIPILEKYKIISENTGSNLFIDPPFDLAKCVLKNFKRKMIVIVPSINEPMGLIVNEVRKLNKNNILVVVNNSGGLKEQVDDEKDGIVVDLNDLEQSAEKIKKHFNMSKMITLNCNAQKTLRNKYDIQKNMESFLENFIQEDIYE